MFGAAALLRYGSSANRTIASVIGGGFDLTKTGTNTLTLTGANTYTGTTTVLAGTLSSTIGNSSSGASGLGAATNPIVVASGATLELAATALRTTIMGNISGTGSINQTLVASLGTHIGGDNSGFAGTYTRTAASTNTLFTSATSGSAAAAWVFDGPSSPSYVAARYGTTADSWVTGFTSGTTNTINFGALSATANCNLGNHTTIASQTANTTYIIGALNTSTTIAGVIADTVIGSTAFTSSTFGITKVGTGTLNCSAANTFTGLMRAAAGTLAHTGTFATTALEVEFHDNGSSTSTTGLLTLGASPTLTAKTINVTRTALSAGATAKAIVTWTGTAVGVPVLKWAGGIQVSGVPFADGARTVTMTFTAGSGVTVTTT
jgi:autotransporter-associated beta strand protein